MPHRGLSGPQRDARFAQMRSEGRPQSVNVERSARSSRFGIPAAFKAQWPVEHSRMLPDAKLRHIRSGRHVDPL